MINLVIGLKEVDLWLIVGIVCRIFMLLLLILLVSIFIVMG